MYIEHKIFFNNNKIWSKTALKDCRNLKKNSIWFVYRVKLKING